MVRPLKNDYVGQKFGMLTVTKMLPRYDGHKTFCECVCDCGNTCIKRSDYMKYNSSETYSCGCVKSNTGKPSPHRKNLVGHRNGKLVVTDMIYGDGETKCVCKCDCGNTIKMLYSVFVRVGKYPKNCGCEKDSIKMDYSRKSRRDLTGKRFGRLTVVEMIYEFRKKTLAKCVCDCGKDVTVPAVYLTSGDTMSCGCLQSEMASIANTIDFTGVVSDIGVEFISKSRHSEHGAWYWNCKCPMCGTIFEEIPARVTGGHTTSCGCNKRSSGEQLVKTVLDKLGVNYELEKRFDDCKDTRAMPFDFYIDDLRIAIEYQGIQHYQVISLFGGETELEKRKLHDNMKRDYCMQNNITLIEIPYTMSNNDVETLITNTIYPERLSYSQQ